MTKQFGVAARITLAAVAISAMGASPALAGESKDHVGSDRSEFVRTAGPNQVADASRAKAGPPSSAPCSAASGVTVCFQKKGDKLWVKDSKKDGHVAVGYWGYIGDGWADHTCSNELGSGTWGICNYNMKEGEELSFRSGVAKKGNPRYPYYMGGIQYAKA